MVSLAMLLRVFHMREWLSGRASPCQGERREFESRLPLHGNSIEFLFLFYFTRTKNHALRKAMVLFMKKTAAVIAEFNPFHNGHKYLLMKIKEDIADRTVVIMSGSFVQRGDIAITDKWTRARAALLNGADLVIELPVIYSMNTAQKFAFGSVATLNATGVIDTLAFGSESGDTSSLLTAASAIADESPEISERIKEYMDQGYNYPLSRRMAFSGIIDTSVLDDPNDILGIEYIRAILETGAEMSYKAITRSGTDHDSSFKTDSIASASEIRRMIRNGNSISDYIPDTHDFNIYDPDILATAVISKIRLSPAEYISEINDVSEGLENKFKKAAASCSSFDELCMAVKSKRYTLSRIRRIAWSILLGLDKDICSMMPSYIRVLGMNKTGMEILRDMKKRSSLPVITKPSSLKNDVIFEKNSDAEDIFALCSNDPSRRIGGTDKKTSPVII